MSVRINQDVLEIAASSSLVAGGNVRINQAEEMIGASGLVGGGNTRVNQLALLVLMPLPTVTQQDLLIGF